MRRFEYVCIFLLMSSLVRAAQGRCGLLNENSSVQDLNSFLQSSLDIPADHRDATCIDFAIRRLEYKASDETAKVLVRYLNFERPVSEAERQGFMIHGPMTDTNMHPAMGTLMTFGQTAIPALLSVIAAPTSETMLHNATRTLMTIFRDEPVKGIEVLQNEATVNPGGAVNLMNAARTAVQWCAKQYRQQCESRVYGHSK